MEESLMECQQIYTKHNNVFLFFAYCERSYYNENGDQRVYRLIPVEPTDNCVVSYNPNMTKDETMKDLASVMAWINRHENGYVFADAVKDKEGRMVDIVLTTNPAATDRLLCEKYHVVK